MKKTVYVWLLVVLLLCSGCSMVKKNIYLPDAKNDKSYSFIGGGNETHKGDGYTISVPVKSYRYEKDYDDGNLEEKWDYIKKDDVKIKVTTYKNTDEITARDRFLRENNDYIFEDLTGYPICGTEFDGDALWFNIYKTDASVYIVSWEYPKNTKDDLKKELSDIAGTFKIVE